jgi:hypothetical protein
MGTYLEVVAKPGCEDQINAAYAKTTGKAGDYLVYSDSVIKSEIAYIHSPEGESQAHLRISLKTVDDWNEFYPGMRVGEGSAKLSGIDDDDAAGIEDIKRTVAFVLEHRMLFSSIKGLDDARRLGYCDFKDDLIEDNKSKKRPPSVEPTFADLPRGQSEFYTKCLSHNRPDLWSAYLGFKDNPCESTWVSLRQKVVPWHSGMGGVWAAVERSATEKDGKDFGLMGRFRDGNVPTLMLVRAALR